MVFFLVDDGLPDHRKTRKLGRGKLPALGLWTLCGPWASKNLTNGFVPAEVVQRYDPNEHFAKQLVDAGFWEEAEQEGERGYQFHDWEDVNFTKEEVLARREQKAAAGRAGGRASARSKAQARAEAGAEAGVRKHRSGGSAGGSEKPSADAEAAAVANGAAPAEAGASEGTKQQVKGRVAQAAATAPAEASTQAKPKQNSTLSNPIPSNSSSSSATPAAVIAEALGLNPDDDEDDEETVKKIYALIIAENNPTAPARYIRTLAANGDLTAYHDRVRRTITAAAYTGPTHPFQASGIPLDTACAHPHCGRPATNRVHQQQPDDNSPM